MTFSIRTRLTLWFAAVIFCGLVLLSVLLFWGVKRSIHSAADKELRGRFKDVAALIQKSVPTLSAAEAQEEFNELGPDELWQARDPQGVWLFQSAAMRPYSAAVFAPTAAEDASFRDLAMPGRHKTVLRIYSAPVQAEGKSYFVQVAADISEYVELLDGLKVVSFIAIPLTLLFACFGGYWLSSRALAPVMAITQEARSITAASLSNRVPLPPHQDELRDLSQTLNAMLDRIESGFRRVQQFSADASHELRTPMSVIRTTAELALRKERDSAAYREALTQVLAESERTSAMIEDLLAIARSDSGAQLSLVRTDVVAIVRDACVKVSPLAEGRGITHHLKLPQEPVYVAADPDALQRLMLVLLDNAIKYSFAGGQIKTHVTDEAAHIVISVEDFGPGIPAQDLPRIFERFYRADPARSREPGGAGLGLSIAKWIADAHRAEVRVTSDPGRGSTFSILLPRA